MPALGAMRDGFTMCATPFIVTGRDAATMAHVEAETRKRIADSSHLRGPYPDAGAVADSMIVVDRYSTQL